MSVSPSAAIFWTLLAGLSIVALLYKKEEKKEGFAPNNNINEGSTRQTTTDVLTSKGKILINQPLQPAQASLNGANAQPSFLPGLLPSAPFGEVSQTAPLPYKDPVMQKASMIQLNSTLEDLRGFLGFEAKGLEDRSDPAIQLPLQRLKGDFQRLSDEFRVLSQSPGIDSQLTVDDINSIRSNLRFLQNTVRAIDANKDSQEGFVDIQGSNQGPRATKDELAELALKLFVEVKRLSASATNDPVTQARINILNNMRQDTMGILAKLNSGAMAATDVPIYQSDIKNILPQLQNANQPLPQLIKKAGLHPALMNLLPVKPGSKEAEYMAQNQEVIKEYMDKLMEGLSWNINLGVEYTSENKRYAGLGSGAGSGTHLGKLTTTGVDDGFQTLFNTGFPSISELQNTTNPNAKFAPGGQQGARDFGLTLQDQQQEAIAAAAPVTNDPGHFEWKTRAKQIREAIRMRGLDPTDFGALTLEQENQVSPSFSWRGYSKMICSRLANTMDPGLPETCGCPPEGWRGWSAPQ
jgi:hypothetical protein